jgi:hypothetical protein
VVETHSHTNPTNSRSFRLRQKRVARAEKNFIKRTPPRGGRNPFIADEADDTEEISSTSESDDPEAPADTDSPEAGEDDTQSTAVKTPSRKHPRTPRNTLPTPQTPESIQAIKEQIKTLKRSLPKHAGKDKRRKHEGGKENQASDGAVEGGAGATGSGKGVDEGNGAVKGGAGAAGSGKGVDEGAANADGVNV